MESAIYDGRVQHTRRLAPSHAFTKRLYLLYLDLAELDRVFEGRWLWGVEQVKLVSFRRADHLGDPTISLDRAVRDLVFVRTGRVIDGPIRLLTQPRTASYVFNPVSFHYCFASSGELDAVVADVSNTPWNERHAYVLPAARGRVDARVPKSFHVSPFQPMSHHYRFFFERPDSSLHARIESFAGDEPVFDARLELERREIGSISLASVLLRFPAMSLQVIGAIYWQAFRLHRLGARFHPHPGSAPPNEVLA
jgi:uncharacterized protein